MIRYAKMIGILCIAALFVYSFDSNPEKKTSSDNSTLTLAFITYNAYGNNLFIDNLTVGKKFGLDVAIAGINNIPKDTSYNSDSSSTITISPRISVVNVGLLPASNFNVTININGIYFSTQMIANIPAGGYQEVTFTPAATLPVGTQMNMVVYSSLDLDTNKNNDTLYQNSIIYRGVKRKLLVEEWTSNTCFSCAGNNPALDAYINSKIDSITAIKYHTGFPAPGTDSFYVSDSAQINKRNSYYNIAAVPTVILDGVRYIEQPFTGNNLDNPIAERRSAGTPVIITVNDARIGTDSISSTITLNIVSPVRYANYKMKVNAIERRRSYQTAPGTNGETQFYDIFRHAYPDINGVSIPSSPGVYTYNYRYKRESSWIDNMLYTSVYIQDDNTREVLNTAKSRNIVLDLPPANKISSGIPFRNVCLSEQQNNSSVGNPINYSGTYREIKSFLNYELFENGFPPAGWKLSNPDNDITFAAYHGANGIAFGGSSSVFMDFYNYSAAGRRDTLISKTFTGVNYLDSVSFDYAHSQYSNENDSLVVLASTDGGVTWQFRVFAKGGPTLATTSSTTQPFVPVSSNQWRTYSFSLQGIVGIHNVSNEIPSGYELKQNFPNPFNPSTNISFSIPKASSVVIRVYDINGKLVDEIYKNNLQAGSYNYLWNALGQSSGVYYYTLESENFRDTKKMVLLK
ncbi:hypothetical protein BH10BAC5_BH10BAC5_14790 [soil metagenome]